MSDFARLRIRMWALLTPIGCLPAISSLLGFVGQIAWWMDLGSHFRVQYTIFFGFLAVAYAAGKKKRWACGALVLTVINALPVAIFLLPLARTLPATGVPLRVMLVNVNTELGSPEKLAAAIEDEKPDILILEEINDQWIKKLSSVLDAYPCRSIQTRDDNFGIGLLCRTPCTTAEITYIGDAGVPSIVAEIMQGPQKLTLLATHPLPPVSSRYAALRNDQLKKVAERAVAISGPLILLGDLNVTPWSYYYREFVSTSGLQNSSEGRGIYATWPSVMPLLLIPIDHCLHTDGIIIQQQRVGRSLGSDHYPLIVEFALR
jgi:endonuclease/exonuclease/phosphatase (EEP) superfamily protein YafD